MDKIDLGYGEKPAEKGSIGWDELANYSLRGQGDLQDLFRNPQYYDESIVAEGWEKVKFPPEYGYVKMARTVIGFLTDEGKAEALKHLKKAAKTLKSCGRIFSLDAEKIMKMLETRHGAEEILKGNTN